VNGCGGEPQKGTKRTGGEEESPSSQEKKGGPVKIQRAARARAALETDSRWRRCGGKELRKIKSEKGKEGFPLFSTYLQAGEG